MDDDDRRSIESASSASSMAPAPINPAHRREFLNARRKAVLEDIDNATFSWYHIRTCLVAGVGFFTDSYDLFAISIAATMIGYVYGRPPDDSTAALSSGTFSNNKLPWRQDAGIKIAAPIGNFFGQLVFGWLADIVGRKRMYGVELMIMITGTFAQALCGSSDSVSFIGSFIVWRFITGFGVGGDYPLSAVITSEFAATRLRGRMMAAVFGAQGIGILAAALVSLAVVGGYDNTRTAHVDASWRLLIGLGCVPAVVGLYFRLNIPETPRFTLDIERNVAQAAQDVEMFYRTGEYARGDNVAVLRVDAPSASRRDFLLYFSHWENRKLLIGTMWSWFATDFAYYGLALNSTNLLSLDTGDSWRNLRQVSLSSLIAVGGLIPGSIVSLFLIDTWGRKNIQYTGFIALTVIFVITSGAYNALVPFDSATNHRNPGAGYAVLYGIANFFQNFGPNTTAFIIPGEIFPTRYRSTAHGISAAAGKVGAILGQIVVIYLQTKSGKHSFGPYLFAILAVFSATGVLSTILLPETMGVTLEKLSNEDQDDFIQGIHVLPMVPGQEALMMGAVGHHQQGSDDSAVGGIE